MTMKKLILLLCLIMVGCNFPDPDHNTPINTSESLQYYTITIDSCEYIESVYQLAHKGNCKFCAERHKQQLKELVEQLKK